LLGLSTLDICQLANYNSLTMEEARANLGRILKQQRVSLPLTLRELSSMSGVSASHLGRIERGERFPSGSVLRKIAGPLGFEEDELFTLAGYLSPQHPGLAESRQGRKEVLKALSLGVLVPPPITFPT
jgi:transcriptional regulator with XRE-family HTH domain